MNPRSIRLFILLLLASASGMAMAAQQDNGANSPPMSLVPQLDPRVRNMYLEIFEPVADTASLPCGNACAKDVIDQFSWIKSWSCIANACNKEGGEGPNSCLKRFEGTMDVSQKELFDNLMCNMVKSPGEETKKALMKAFPSAKEAGWVEGMAYIYAFEGNVTACQDEIKHYVGPYGLAWNARWYADISGCSIIAKKRTLEQEETDFSAWFGGDCSKIVNPELREACGTSGAPLPDAAVPDSDGM